jgi:uncharacterized membrane protein YdbT with pleckstrin-like domain
LTIAALGAAVVLPEAVIPVAFGAGILGTSMAVGISYFFISVVIIVLLQWRLGIYCLGRRL